MIKKVDIFTLVISSFTLILFCLSSGYMLYRYNQIKIGKQQWTATEITRTEQAIEQLTNHISLDRQALRTQLESNKQLMQAGQDEWQLLNQTLTSFIWMLSVIVLFHLFFVWILFKSK